MNATQQEKGGGGRASIFALPGLPGWIVLGPLARVPVCEKCLWGPRAQGGTPLSSPHFAPWAHVPSPRPGTMAYGTGQLDRPWQGRVAIFGTKMGSGGHRMSWEAVGRG